MLYSKKRHWYHISTTLEKEEETLIPRDFEEGFNRTPAEPLGARICVAPTIAQCITAVPYALGEVFTVYKTKEKVLASKPDGVFDINVTNEGWLLEPTLFIKLGYLDFQQVEDVLKIKNVIPQSASSSEPKYAGKVLKWWKKVGVNRFVKNS